MYPTAHQRVNSLYCQNIFRYFFYTQSSGLQPDCRTTTPSMWLSWHTESWRAADHLYRDEILCIRKYFYHRIVLDVAPASSSCVGDSFSFIIGIIYIIIGRNGEGVATTTEMSALGTNPGYVPHIRTALLPRLWLLQKQATGGDLIPATYARIFSSTPWGKSLAGPSS